MPCCGSGKALRLWMTGGTLVLMDNVEPHPGTQNSVHGRAAAGSWFTPRCPDSEEELEIRTSGWTVILRYKQSILKIFLAFFSHFSLELFLGRCFGFLEKQILEEKLREERKAEAGDSKKLDQIFTIFLYHEVPTDYNSLRMHVLASEDPFCRAKAPQTLRAQRNAKQPVGWRAGQPDSSLIQCKLPEAQVTPLGSEVRVVVRTTSNDGWKRTVYLLSASHKRLLSMSLLRVRRLKYSQSLTLKVMALNSGNVQRASVTTSSVDTTAHAAINIGPARYRQTMNEWMSEDGKQVVGPRPAS
ncbi:hypothetical protein MJG53_015683 [Ovis ammon polii x Ovis aries]|uniref:Uncharacterized protein n=1 Tax=Ovis ammon polii x Ovis aries TaxID=2918886 RepID=A0ACB9UFH4_9CETA|nr:hypothetical protein MJG53_015683 [Ovis ammon polii x Ovis aries]